MNDLTLKNIEKLIKGSEKRIVKQNQEYVGQAISASEKRIVKQNQEYVGQAISASEKRIVKQNQEYVGQAIDAILSGVQSMFNERDVKIDRLETGLNEVKNDIKFLRQDIKDIEAELSDKPSRRQFEELKSKYNFA